MAGTSVLWIIATWREPSPSILVGQTTRHHDEDDERMDLPDGFDSDRVRAAHARLEPAAGSHGIANSTDPTV